MSYYAQSLSTKRAATRNQRRRRKLIQQRLMGFAMLIMGAVYLWLALQGETVEERDCTAILFIAPMALSLLFSKRIIIM